MKCCCPSRAAAERRLQRRAGALGAPGPATPARARRQALEAPAFQERIVRSAGRYAAAMRQRAALAEVAAGLAATDLGESCRMRTSVIPVAVARRCAGPSCLHWCQGPG